MSTSISHLSAHNHPTMVDVGAKPVTQRTAKAQALVRWPAAVYALLEQEEIHTPKGPVLHTAIIAGTMAAKRTAEIIPFCHPLGLERCTFSMTPEKTHLRIECTCAVAAKTGVEMEALTGAATAALTVYDMLKSASRDLVIEEVRLLAKTGGKSSPQP